MNDESMQRAASALADRVGRQAARKLRARRDGTPGVWFGLGMMGLVGWSVAVPTLLGAGLGLWLDHHHPGGHSWTLALLVAGLTLGCLNAWRWVAGEDRAMHRDETGDAGGGGGSGGGGGGRGAGGRGAGGDGGTGGRGHG